MCPTDLQFLPNSGGESSLSRHDELILLTSNEGKFYIVTKQGNIEKSVNAHKGAVLVGQWGYTGTSLLTGNSCTFYFCKNDDNFNSTEYIRTGGEDGFLKVWSRSGMLRSVIASTNNPIYAACWSPDNLAIAYSQQTLIVIKSLSPNTKALQVDNKIFKYFYSYQSTYSVERT